MSEEILIISEAYGGGVKTHIDSIKKYSSYNIKVIIFGENENVDKENNIDYIGKGRKRIFKFLLFDTLKLVKFVKNRNIKIIHAHSTFCGVQMLILKSLNPHIKIIFTPHAYYSQKPNLSLIKKGIIVTLERMIANVSQKIIHVSESEELHAIDNKIISSIDSKSIVIYNGVPNPRVENSDVTEDKKIRIGSLSRLDEQKNPIRYLELAKAIQEKSKKNNFEFYYGGDGPLKKRMEQYIQDNNMESYFFLLGNINYENIEKHFFNKIDIYMSTAQYEGLPYSVIEALSYKKPVILSDVIGHKELYMNNGMIFDLKNQNSDIASDIISIFEQNDLYKLSEKSYFHFLSHFEIINNISLIDKVYKGE